MSGHSQLPRRLLMPAAAALMLLAGTVLSGCTVIGAFTGGVIGAALGGPEGAAAGAELGMYMGASVDASLLELLDGEPDYRAGGGDYYYEWCADEYDDDYHDEYDDEWVDAPLEPVEAR